MIHNHQFSRAVHSSRDRVMTAEQFTQVVAAIADGKYSLACVLILRFAGYNPRHYIPYRTYNRIEKEHKAVMRSAPQPELTDPRTSNRQLEDIDDLGYLEAVSESSRQVRGGLFHTWSQQGCRPSWASISST